MLVLLQVMQKITLLVQAGGSDDSKDVTSASVSYAVASGVTAILGYTSVEASDEGASTDDGSAWYIGANMAF